MAFQLLAGVIISIFFSIFFSGIEVAFLSANKLQIELMGKQRNIAGMIMTFFVERPTWFIGTTLIGNIASLILFGFFSTHAVLFIFKDLFLSYPATQYLIIAVQAFLLTLLLLYSVEFLSKGFFVINSTQVATALAIPFVLLAII